MHFGLAKLMEGKWTGVEGEIETLVNSVWAGSLGLGGLSLLVPESAVKCPVEDTHAQQPKKSQCDQHTRCLSQGWGILIRVFKCVCVCYLCVSECRLKKKECRWAPIGLCIRNTHIHTHCLHTELFVATVTLCPTPMLGLSQCRPPLLPLSTMKRRTAIHQVFLNTFFDKCLLCTAFFFIKSP